MIRIQVCLFVLLAAGCSSKPDIAASNYDQTCAVASDCMVIFEGRVCGCDNACPSAAINVRDSDKYQSDHSYEGCPFNPLAPSCDCDAQYQPTCVNGKCGLVEQPWSLTDGGVADGG